jgi:peptidoglycan/LPS O-acetylase OafA/YrhL
MEVKRLAELDGLRGLAAIAVVLYHYFYHYDGIYGHQFNVPEVFRLGFYGVHLFFMVSGFVIYWTISRSEKPLDFIWSRFSRLYPPFWTALVFTFVVVAIFSLPGREATTSTFLLNFFMFHEYFGVKHVDGVYWTLTLELAFYFWVLTIFCLGQIKRIEYIMIIWIIIASVVSFNVLGLQLSPVFKKFLLLDYISLFAAGISFFKYRIKDHSNVTNVLVALSILSLFVNHSYKVGLLLCCFYLIFWLITIDKLKVLASRPLVYLGTISYSLYLVHQNLSYIIINEFYTLNLNPLFGIAVALFVSILIAHLIMVYVEKPSLRKLRAFYKSSDTMQSLRNTLSVPEKQKQKQK